MNSETPPSSDPLFGNNPSDLMREAMDPATRIPTGDPRYWQPPTPEDLQARLGGSYLVQAFLARGGMGAVYRGIQASLERPVAIKILPPQLRDADPSFAQRFKQEAKAMAQLNHPSIVSVYDFGEMPDGTLYFIMEFVDGTDVAQMVTRQGRLSSKHAMAITAHVCDALQYAHEHGVVHRDIKPANIMVGNDGRVKVADFGLAKSSRVTATSLTMTGHVMGTPHFVAPEALTLGSTVDHRADIYAVGVMLYQMLTGRLPQGIFEMPSMLVAGLDPRYDTIIASAMREDRGARYQAILDMRRALDAILTKPVAKSQAAQQKPAAAAAPPAQTAAPKPQPVQHYYRPPQAAAPQPRIKEKSNTTTWLLAAAVVLSLGGIVWMKMGNSASSAKTPSVAQSNVAAPDSPKPSQMGPIGDLVFPTVTFQDATISECLEYFQIKSRDLDPGKKGITFLVDEATRKSGASITIDLKEIRVADLIECFARFARLEVSYVGEAVRLKASPSVKPPFPIGTPTSKLQQLGKTIIPIMQFNKANIDEPCEYLRIKGREFSGLPVNLIIDPDFTQRKHEITLDLTQVPLSDALAYVTEMCDAEVTYLAAAIYIQPRSSSAAQSPLKIGTPTSKLQQVGQTIFPTVSFQNATLEEACEYIRIKGKDISGLPVNLIIAPELSRQEHGISIDVHQVPLSAALSYIADLCDAEVAYLREAFYLQPRSTKPVQVDPYANQPWGEVGKGILPSVRFHNATVGEAVEYLRFKSRDLDPEKKGMVIVLDDAASRAAGAITLDSKNITVANALAQIATVAGLEIYRLGEAARLRAPATAKTTTAAAPKHALTTGAVSMPKLDETGFAPLLDKEHFAFWKQAGKGTVTFEDGTLFPNGNNEDGAKCFWYSERMLGDFTLRVEFFVHDRQANSGVMIRFPDPGSDGSAPNMKGYEIDISPRATGDIWRWLGGSADDHLASTRPVKYDGWNLYEISVIGQKYTVKLNGQLVNEYEGRVGLRGYVGLQNCSPNGGVSFRNVRIKEMSASTPKTAAAETDSDLRTFTDRQGRRIRAALIRVQNDDVTLKREDGQEFSIKGSMLSDSDIGYLKPKGLVLPQAPAVAAATTPAEPKIPVAAPPTNARVIDPVNMMLKEPWIPPNVHTRKEWLANLAFYSQEVVKDGTAAPAKIWGPFTWLMPITRATDALPRGSYKLRSDRAAKLAFPQGTNLHFWHVGDKGYEDDGEHFDEIVFVTDDVDRVISIQLTENNLKTLNWIWKNKTLPDGERNPYYNYLHDRSNAKNGRVVKYQFRPAGAGVTNVKIVLEGTESVHWYLAAPLADKLIQISKSVNP
jgi:serine/threonine protein kinase